MSFFSRKPGQSSTSDSGYSNDPRVDLSISQVQRRPHSKSPSPQRMPSLPTVMEERSEDASSVSRRSLSTQSTLTDDRDSVDLADAVRSYQLSRTQAIPSLPTIDSGEPLTWDAMRPPTDDPFTTPTRPRTFLPSHDYERPQSTSSFHSAWSVPSRPNSAFPSSLSQDPYTPPHQPQVGIRLLSGKSPVDHFKYDAEGYATGAFPRSLYRSPRSRSPTPAVDDEDYRISADGSVHYSGQPRMAGHTYDNTRSVRQPQYTEVAEGDDDEDGEYEEDDDEDTREGGDDDTKDNGEREGEEDDDEYETEDDISEKPKYMPKPKKWINFSGLSPDTTSADPVDPVPQTTQHFGPAPTGRIHRRHKKRRVQLTNGNLRIDLPVPSKLILPLRKSDEETGFTRYTAVTCDPDEFEKSGFFLRQNEQNRPTELFICVTMYNVRFRLSAPRLSC
jgi:chitin synthase